MATALVMHGHFYQPPRESPWTGVVPQEPSAHPYRDWNERIYQECYRANAYSRILDQFGRTDGIINNYALISFNFGSTLLNWLQDTHPGTYQRILEADRQSVRERSGHGNAIAQGYSHAILPLCNARDRITEVRWGMADFRHRFGREPESLWLPETACNDEVLALLIDEGLRYVILSPDQAQRVRPADWGEWRDVSDGSIDPGVAYKYLHPDGSGRSIALFFYDGPIARAIAFEGALVSAEGLVDRFQRAYGGEGRMVHVATDGESYGHHFRHGERGLGYALQVVAKARGFWVTNYGEYLQRYPPDQIAEIKNGDLGEGTAWSCAHGVGRWYRDCGCHTGGQQGWSQAWRTPLRQALEFLRDRAAECFEDMTGDMFSDPWEVRNAYIELVLDRKRSREEFLRRHAGRGMREAEQTRAATLLEMQRAALFMFTSCGWFFADISGIETVQVLRYAGRVLDYMDELDIEAPREEFLEILAEAKSNLPQIGNGAEVFRRFVEPSRVSAEGVAAHLAITELVREHPNAGTTYGYYYTKKDFQTQQHGRVRMTTGRLTLESVMTGCLLDLAFAAMHLGGIDFYCVLKAFPGAQRFRRSVERLWSDFRTASLPVMLRIAQEEFGPDEYGLQHVLAEGRSEISNLVYGGVVERFTQQYVHLYEDNARLIDLLQDAGFDLPPALRMAAEFTLGVRFEQEISRLQESADPKSYERAFEIAGEVARRGYRIDHTMANALFSSRINRAVAAATSEVSEEAARLALTLLAIMRQLNLTADVRQAQERMYEMLVAGQPVPPVMLELAAALHLGQQPIQTALEANSPESA